VFVYSLLRPHGDQRHFSLESQGIAVMGSQGGKALIVTTLDKSGEVSEPQWMQAPGTIAAVVRGHFAVMKIQTQPTVVPRLPQNQRAGIMPP
jgi:hypothetical protein